MPQLFTKKTLLLTALLTTISASTVYAATQTGTATATIRAAITVTAGQTMQFGTIGATATQGKIALSVAGARSLSTGTNPLYTTSQQGTFTITAEPSTALTISAANTTLSDGASHTMALDTYTFNPTSGSSTDGTGNMTLNVGATLTVAANQVSGAYTGTYTLTVVY